MSKSTNELHLTVSNKCGEDKKGSKCKCNDPPLGITASRNDNPEGVKGFSALVHDRNRIPFRLSKYLDSGEELEDGISAIYGVTRVSVYYWVGDGNHESPLLLEVETNGSHKKYYYKDEGTIGPTIWKLNRVDHPLQVMLDDQNCRRNSAVPFNIKDYKSGDLLKESKSECIQNKTIKSTQSPDNSPGSNYEVYQYSITGDTKISRVTLRGKPINITFSKYDAVSQIKLYSYPGTRDVPLMLEFKLKDGKSEWHYSTDSKGQNWATVIGSNFYDSSGNPLPALSEQLDKVLCSQSSNVTLDVTYENYSSGGKDCCDEHKNRVTVTLESVKVKGNNNISTQYYKYSLPKERPNLGGIKYYNNSDRNNIKSQGLKLPASVDSVYAFYCNGNEPSLIYVDSKSVVARGWYKKDDNSEEWTWIAELSGIKRTDIDNGLTCAKWKRLKKYLTGPSCSELSDCSYGSYDEQKNQEENLKLEEQEAIKQREKTLQLPPPTVPPLSPSSNSSVSSTSSGSSSSGGSESSGSGYSPPEVAINLSEKPEGNPPTRTYEGGTPTGGEQITVTIDEEPPGSDFLKFTHKVSGGGTKVFKLTQVLHTRLNFIILHLRSHYDDLFVGPKAQNFPR